MSKAFFIWLDIAIMMFFIIFGEFMIFTDIMMYTRYAFYMKDIFIFIFIITIFASMFFVGYFFEKHNIKVEAKNKFSRYLKIYFNVLWRALIIVMPVIGIIAVTFHGSIGSRIATIFIEIAGGFPAIWWYLKSLRQI